MWINWIPGSFFTRSLSPSRLSGVLPGEAEDLWEHGHGHEAAEPPGQTSKGQAVKPRAGVELWPELQKQIAYSC